MTSGPATSMAGCGCTPTWPTGACIGELSSPEQRLVGVRDAVADETEPLVALTHLLRLCRDEHPTLWGRMNDRDCRNHVDCLRADFADVLPPRGSESTVSSDLRRALVAALAPVGRIPPVVVARALAELLDATFAHTFSASFARRSPYQPRLGDPVPLDRPDLRRVTDLPATSPPWRLANRLDETRRVRLASSSPPASPARSVPWPRRHPISPPGITTSTSRPPPRPPSSTPSPPPSARWPPG